MMSRSVRALLRRVQQADESSDDRYAAALRQRLPDAPLMSPSALAMEIASEISRSLGKAGQRLEAALLELRRIETELDALSDVTSEERSALCAAFNRQRLVAERRLWELRIQREALGFRRHDELNRLYPLPAPKSEASRP